MVFVKELLQSNEFSSLVATLLRLVDVSISLWLIPFLEIIKIDIYICQLYSQPLLFQIHIFICYSSDSHIICFTVRPRITLLRLTLFHYNAVFFVNLIFLTDTHYRGFLIIVLKKSEIKIRFTPKYYELLLLCYYAVSQGF